MDNQVALNDILEINITDIGNEGEGIGKSDGLTVFVEAAIPGDTIKCSVTEVKKNYVKAKLIEVLNTSPNRIKPPCTYFENCGGCQIQNMSYEAQLKVKQSMVENAIKRIGGFESVDIKPIIGMKDSFRYRNKGVYLVQNGSSGVEIGFNKKKSHNIVDVEDCLLQDKKIAEITKVFKTYMKDFGVQAYNEKTHKGIIRHIMVRKSDKTGEMMVVVVTNGRKLAMTKTLASKLVEVNPSIVSVVQIINNLKNSSDVIEETKLLYGKETIQDQIGDLVFEISPASFYQVNSVQTEVLYEKALEYADLKGEETVFDIYSGTGTISLFLAQRAKIVYGLENCAEAVENAERNKVINKIDNVKFELGQAEEAVVKLYEEGIQADVVVVDPPRSGCDKAVIDTMLKMQPKRIVYVSCKPSTLARDLKEICADGYEVVEVQPVDMFPHTAHVETVVLMSRVKVNTMF